MNFVIGNSSWRAWQTLRPPVPCCNFLYIWIGWLHHVYSANTPTLKLQACNSPLVVQASVGVNDCGTWDMDGWMIALFSPFFHPQDYKAGTGGRQKEQSERRRERARVRMSEITPEDWQHRGRGNWTTRQQGPMALWWSRSCLWSQMLGGKTDLHQLHAMLP